MFRLPRKEYSMLSNNQLEVASKVFAKNEKADFGSGIKQFILNECIELSSSKVSILCSVQDPDVYDILNEFLFEFSAPWLYREGTYISKADYSRLKSFVAIDPSLKKILSSAAEIISNNIEQDFKD